MTSVLHFSFELRFAQCAELKNNVWLHLQVHRSKPWNQSRTTHIEHVLWTLLKWWYTDSPSNNMAKTLDDILLSPLFSWDCWLKNHDPSPRVSFFLTSQLRHYSPFWKLFNLLTAPVYCGCCALIGSLLTWPWLALKIDITAALDSGPLSFSLCTVLNEKGNRGTVWKWIKRAEDFEFSSAGDFAIERKKLRRAEDLPPKTEGLAPLKTMSQTPTMGHVENRSHLYVIVLSNSLLLQIPFCVTQNRLVLMALKLILRDWNCSWRKNRKFLGGQGACPSENSESQD